MIETGLLDWADLERVMSVAPARIGDVQGHGQPLAVGSPAELVLIDPSARREFGIADLAGKSVNSPYLGRSLPGAVIATFHHGAPTVLDGRIVEREVHARA